MALTPAELKYYSKKISGPAALAKRAIQADTDGEKGNATGLYISSTISFLSLLGDSETQNDRRIMTAALRNCVSYLNRAMELVHEAGLGRPVQVECAGVSMEQDNSIEPADDQQDSIEPAGEEQDSMEQDGEQLDHGCSQIIGHPHAKTVLLETIVWPVKYPQFYNKPPNYRSTWTGILMFGPPGTGKTALVSAVAKEAKSTFIKISIGEIMGKYFGESEKNITEKFTFAKSHQPAVMFIDEIDAIMAKRSDSESSEDTNRIKSHLLDEMNGLEGTRVTLIGATNLPESFDNAFKRRFTQRLYVPLPTVQERCGLFKLYLKNKNHNMSGSKIAQLAQMAQDFSGSDIQNVIQEASQMNVRQAVKKFEKSKKSLSEFKRKGDTTMLTYDDVRKALKNQKPTTAPYEIRRFDRIASKFGNAAGTI